MQDAREKIINALADMQKTIEKDLQEVNELPTAKAHYEGQINALKYAQNIVNIYLKEN